MDSDDTGRACSGPCVAIDVTMDEHVNRVKRTRKVEEQKGNRRWSNLFDDLREQDFCTFLRQPASRFEFHGSPGPRPGERCQEAEDRY